ncbi:MAG: hypothetical protein HOB73_01005 [Planctomycetaceae bacterium]|nr:hypothetical protein [Planctomycetaceae bacterium]
MTRGIIHKYALWLLAIVAVVTVLGAAWPVLFNEGSATGKLLMRTYEVDAVGDVDFEAAMVAELYEETLEVTASKPESDPAAIAARVSRLRQLDRGVAIMCLLITVGLPITCRKWPKLSWLYLVPALWILANAQATAMNGSKAFAELAVPAHATRWGMLVALALLLLRNPQSDRIANWVLRIACALTFAVHGWESFQLNPPFQDLLYITAGHVGIGLSEWTCHGLLRTIGIMDLIFAVSVVAVHHRRMLYWMGCWGLITAASRPIAMGLDAWPEFAMRLPNSVAPLLVLFLGLRAMFSLSSSTTNRNPLLYE